LGIISWGLISGAISSFLAMNFTGASTYTSLSGVRKEMKFFVPLQLTLAIFGITGLVISKLI
jgi:acetyl-CoA decarbonylase/synthase complex subunit gamma